MTESVCKRTMLKESEKGLLATLKVQNDWLSKRGPFDSPKVQKATNSEKGMPDDPNATVQKGNPEWIQRRKECRHREPEPHVDLTSFRKEGKTLRAQPNVTSKKMQTKMQNKSTETR